MQPQSLTQCPHEHKLPGLRPQTVNKRFHIPELHFLLNSTLPAPARGPEPPCLTLPPVCFSPDAAETEEVCYSEKVSLFWG